MQLKGLVRFFTILLILYSIYELSFTWVVRSHEKKMEATAKREVARLLPNGSPAEKDALEKERLKRLLDSTENTTVHYGFTGPISYKKAKAEELNLGLDLQGGINVTLEVELSGLIRALSNNPADPNLNKALENASVRKANGSADYVDLFIDEYKKLSNNAPLARIFATSSTQGIKITDTDAQVETSIRSSAYSAFDNTFKVLQTRIDQFGVAQPNINPDRDRGIITVELPGVDDQERVRKYLQSSANLQFWEVYQVGEIWQSFTKANDEFIKLNKGNTATTTPTPAATPATADTARRGGTDTTGRSTDTSRRLSEQLAKQKDTAASKTPATSQDLGLFQYIIPPIDQQGRLIPTGWLGEVRINDTGIVRRYLNSLDQYFPADLEWMFGVPPTDGNSKAVTVPLYAIKTYGNPKAPIEGDVIENASQTYDQFGKVVVSMDMNSAGAREWEKLTAKSAKEKVPIAIVLDNLVYSAPVANETISGGRSQISGNFQVTEATDLANILKAGKLPAPARIVQEQVVGPTLGQDAIKGGFLAFLISFIVIFLLMLIYYNTSGWIANIALILNLLFTIGVLTGLGATLTAPGIAGLVLTIGMAVDTNVIIYERIKEELTRGKAYIPAVNAGYRRSLPPVLDGHITTLLTAIILFSFGLGPVKGFATTQIIGLLLSLFCGILVSRWVTDWFTNKKKHLEYFTPISRRIFKHANFKFIEYRKVAYGISLVVLALGIGAFFNGFDYGVEFKGGRSYTVQFPQNVQVEQVRQNLENTFNENPVIKTIGNSSRLDITTSYQIENSTPAADSIVENTLFTGLNKWLPANLTYQQFRNPQNGYLVGSTKVLPTISADLKRGAQWATFWSLLLISIYIFIRFRDWRYALGTIVALLHDVLVTLIVFSFAREFVPFPLEIDQHFIAAILTVIGFSMNDTVIVFDRIREYNREMPGQPKGVIINRAINDTLSRTIMTSLTVFLTILILFIFGGEVTRGFAFAMLIGVITGIYSSVYVAAPVLVDLGGNRAIGENLLPEQSKTKTKVVANHH
jgi:SecD/SecF fusion protein